MDSQHANRTRVRFGTFELDLESGDIRRAGVAVHLPAQPTAVLMFLIRRAGSLVTRQEIGHLLWHDRWEEFDPGINTCISQIRSALGDNATSPTYVATVTRRGYRFVAPVEWLPAESEWPTDSGSRGDAPPVRSTARRRIWPLAAAALVVLGAFAAVTAVLRAGKASDPRLMIAVLPFEALDGDSTHAWLGAGLTEELITLLANVEPDRLGVIARTSSAAVARSGATVGAIGKALGVDFVVDGAIRSDPERVRITAQLIRVDDESHVWAEAFDRAVVDALDVQRDVARRVTGALAVSLATGSLPDRGEPVSPARLRTLEARWLLDRGGAAEADRAVALLDSAISADSSYAPAWTTRALALAARSTGSAEDVERVRRAARRAVALDDQQVDAHLRLGIVAYQRDWDRDAAEFEFRRTLTLGPGRAAVHHNRALFLAATGRLDEATAAIEEAMRLDPVSTLVIGDAAFVHYLARDYDRANLYAERVLALDEQNVATLSLLTNLDAVRERPSDLVRHADALNRAINGPDAALDSTAWQDRDAGAVFWPAWIAWWRANSSGPTRAYQSAIGFGHLGQADSALAELEAGFALRSGGLAFLAVEPAFDLIRGRDRFDRLVRAIGLIEPAASYVPASN